MGAEKKYFVNTYFLDSNKKNPDISLTFSKKHVKNLLTIRWLKCYSFRLFFFVKKKQGRFLLLLWNIYIRIRK